MTLAVIIHVILNDPVTDAHIHPSAPVMYVYMKLCIIHIYSVSLCVYLRYHNITSDIIISRSLDIHIYKQTDDIPVLYVVSMHAHVCMNTIYMLSLHICTVSMPH